MRTFFYSLTAVVWLLVTACSTPDRRIAAQQAVFDQYSADVQQKIRAGRVDIGFTPEMVRLALGEPARKSNRRTEAGDFEVWSYNRAGPHFSLGVGVASGGYHSGVGGAVGMSSDDYDSKETIRIEFHAGRVSGIDAPKK